MEEKNSEEKVSLEDFEKYFKRLKEIVEIFSQNTNLPLEKRLNLFKEGMDAYNKCKSIVDKAEAEAKRMMETGDYKSLIKEEY